MTSTTKTDEVARALVASAKGILAADETPKTITKRLTALGIESTPDSRRAFREMLFTTPGIKDFISGAIMQDETIRQNASSGTPLVDVLIQQGVIPGIKVDASTHPMAGAPGEVITEGLDALRDRLKTYRQIGARFAKWRAVVRIGQGLPTPRSIRANAHALARYAVLCQEEDLVPIVEPEVLMDGDHSIERCEEVTSYVLQTVFDALFDQCVRPESMLLKPNMVIAGSEAPRRAGVEEVAAATLRTLERHVPPAVPGVVFLSGGQGDLLATQHLTAINQYAGPKPWKLSFSFGRALQDESMRAWGGDPLHVFAGQRAFHHRARCVSAAAMGRYDGAVEAEQAFV
jgi:fructose-bisphosphate aldolase class I